MKIQAGELEIEIREGIPADIPQVLAFIREMAAFEKLPVYATEPMLQDAFFGPRPAANLLMIFHGTTPIAYAEYFFTFSSMLGKRGLWLDDIYVTPAYRGKKIGQAVMAYVADIAVKNNCGRFEWSVLDWNENAIQFYKKLGANVMDEWRICRMEGDEITPLAAALKSHS